MNNEQQTAFCDLPLDHFPFTIEIIDDDLGVVWSTTVEGMCALDVPGLGPERASHRTTRITYANGEVVEAKANG